MKNLKTNYDEHGLTNRFTFNYYDPTGILKAASQTIFTFDAAHTLPTHFVACEHPEGKVWESLFIPNNAGGHGLSITWWARKGAANGSLGVKEVTELEWYNIVQSKAVLKGYNVLHLTGLTTPLTTRHRFINELVEKGKVAPSLALMAAGYTSHSDVKKRIVAAYLSYKPILNFLLKLNAKGHSDSLMFQAHRSITGMPSDVIKQVLASLTSGEILFNDSMETKPAVLVETLTERYGSTWGAFG